MIMSHLTLEQTFHDALQTAHGSAVSLQLKEHVRLTVWENKHLKLAYTKWCTRGLTRRKDSCMHFLTFWDHQLSCWSTTYPHYVSPRLTYMHLTHIQEAGPFS